MKKEDIERFVASRIVEAIGRELGQPSEDEIKSLDVRLALNDSMPKEDQIFAGMKFEIMEDPDEVKIAREIMEEPQNFFNAVVTFRAPGELKRIHLQVNAPEGPDLKMSKDAGTETAEDAASEDKSDACGS